MDTARYLPRAQRVAAAIPGILKNRNLEPAISRYVLTGSDRDGAWLFAVLDDARISRIERYTASETIHQISTALGGLPVVVSNTTGLRYAVLLSERPELPKLASFPGYQAGVIRLGVGLGGEISTSWGEFGNAVIAGITRFGKSNALRLVTGQALADGHQVILIDPDGQTFPPSLAGHSQVIAYAAGVSGAMEAVERAGEIFRERQETFTQARAGGGEPPAMPRVFVVCDEYTSLMQFYGGRNSPFSQGIAALAWGGLKFGVHVVLGGHEWTRDLVGPVASQMVTRICFAVRAPSISRVVLSRMGAERIKVRGRALTDPWGWVQVYMMSDEDFSALAGGGSGSGMTDYEEGIRAFLVANAGGRMTHEALAQMGFRRSQRDRIRRDWIERGLAVYSPEDNNSIVLVQKDDD